MHPIFRFFSLGLLATVLLLDLGATDRGANRLTDGVRRDQTWVISIGIDDIGAQKLKNCKSDAARFVEFFRAQHSKWYGEGSEKNYHSWYLPDSLATRKAIFSALKEIASKADQDDNFIFVFDGLSWIFPSEKGDTVTCFFPYDVMLGNRAEVLNRKKETTGAMDSLISMKTLQEYIQLIPCVNQLFISEAGSSENFKTEFIRNMMMNSPELSSLLNINRVIIVPNFMGLDNMPGRNDIGPLTYYITSLDSTNNIFQLFDPKKADYLAYLLKAKEVKEPTYSTNYFDVFFERKFLKQYRDIFGDGPGKTRGGKTSSTEFQNVEGLSGDRYALVVGTDNYKGKGWDKLSNPVYDAKEIAEVLEKEYDFKVMFLPDSGSNSIYRALRDLYKKLKTNDQLIVYIAGHGDIDQGLLDDGFIVCSDSKSVEEDPMRETYIQHTKLKKMINKMPARQVMVLLDICHGGVFDENVLGKTRNNPANDITNLNLLEFVKEKSQYSTRKVLSSVGKEAAFDGAAGKHSPFAAYLLNILRARGGTQGIITLSDIYSLLQKASFNETATFKISPHLAGFGDDNALSEFFLIPVEKK